MGTTQIANPAGLFGLSNTYDVVAEQWVNGDSAAVTKGFLVVASSTNGKVTIATTAAGQDLISVGVAAEQIAVGKVGLVLTHGFCDFAVADFANPAVGDQLTIPASTTGRLGKLTLATTSLGRVIGVVTQGATQAAGVAIPGAYIHKM